MARDGKLPVSFHTAHGWVLRTDCDEIDIFKRVVGSAPIQIMPDGTGFKGEDQNVRLYSPLAEMGDSSASFVDG
ncbi:MAG: hypothetical protein PHI85_07565 [Victivallaceae bacterium]|nr:hypothetical protein [Victivallaceae bacterium]